VPVLLYRQDLMAYFIAKQIQAKNGHANEWIRNAPLWYLCSILNYYKPYPITRTQVKKSLEFKFNIFFFILRSDETKRLIIYSWYNIKTIKRSLLVVTKTFQHVYVASPVLFTFTYNSMWICFPKISLNRHESPSLLFSAAPLCPIIIPFGSHAPP
jgi:hypothetical protein